jgi:hypothetical protein
MVSLLNEVGFALPGAMGAVSLSWSEIESWLRCTKYELSVWETTTLKEMSEVYVSELHKATAKDAAPPYIHVTEDIVQQRKAVDTKLRNVFASFRRNRTGEPETQD